MVEHFYVSHYKDDSSRFVLLLPWKPGVIALGESRTQALERYSRLERSLWKRGTFEEFVDVIHKDFELNDPKLVLGGSRQAVHGRNKFPMHAARKETICNCKIRIVFEASTMTTFGTS